MNFFPASCLQQLLPALPSVSPYTQSAPDWAAAIVSCVALSARAVTAALTAIFRHPTFRPPKLYRRRRRPCLPVRIPVAPAAPGLAAPPFRRLPIPGRSSLRWSSSSMRSFFFRVFIQKPHLFTYVRTAQGLVARISYGLLYLRVLSAPLSRRRATLNRRGSF